MTRVAMAAKTIRQQLKEKGWGSRQISVRSESFSMGSAICVSVRDLSIPLDEVKAIAKSAESIDRCPVTGDILGGCNRYVTVQYDS